MGHEMQSLTKVVLSVFPSLCYCYFISSTIPKGKLRLLSLVPVFVLFSFLPLLFSAALSSAIAALFLTWLGNFKLILFAFDIGPLSKPKTFSHFLLLACFPIKITPDKPYQSPKPAAALPLNWPVKALICAVMLFLWDHKDFFHAKLVLLGYSLVLYLLVDLVMGLCNAAARATVGAELESPSDEPYLSTSLQDFWGRRWNLMTSNIMRLTVFKPVRLVFLKVVGPRPAQAAAVFATFVVSGLMHEVMFYYVMRLAPSWEMLCLFVIHGVCVVVESEVKRWWSESGRKPLPTVVSVLLTAVFVLGTTDRFFFAPLVRNGVDVRTFDELKGLFGKKGQVFIV